MKLSLAEMIASAIKIAKGNTYSVKVENQLKLPDVQKISGEVTVKDLEGLILGLDQVIKSVKSLPQMERADLSALEKAVKDIKFPDHPKMPEPLKTVEVTNLNELLKPLAKLASKLDTKSPTIHFPPPLKSVSVSNLEAIETILSSIQDKLEKKDEDPTGFSFERDSTGKLKTLTEIYPSGSVVSTGWNLGRVTVEDNRES